MVGDYVYVADERTGLRVISVENKANPVEVGYFDTPGWAEGVHVVGEYAYIADSRGGFVILRIAKPEHWIYLPIVLKNFGP